MSTNPPLTCSRCGAVIAPGARFCASCGLDISSSQGGVTTLRVNSPLAAVRGDALLQALRDATLGEYDVLGELGRGGMATVYLAHDIALDRKVAIKVMSPALMAGEGMAERFKREARTAGQLSHPHIIPIYAVRESGDLLYFVMKFIAGRSLDSIIREVGPLPIPMVQTILQQVGSALGYAHRRGVIHRDIKPANIMLDADGWAIVTDFGIAKVSETQGLTLTGATVGTPSYMSPEQCAAKELTGASDQYSLGVVAYEMLSGKLPFVAESVMAVMYAHFNEPPPPIALTRPDCPPALAEAVMRMLEKDPGHRFPSMEAATAAVGAAPLAPDDPVRTQMITLAARGESIQLLDRLSTPVSRPSVAGYGVGTSGGRPQIATLLIAPGRVTVAAGEAVQLRATAKSRSGKTVGSLPVSWASTNSDVAEVAANGLVTAVAPGTVTITASSGKTSATAVVTVVAAQRSARRFALVGGGIALAAVAAGLIFFHPFGGAAPEVRAPADTVTHVAGRPDTSRQAAPAPIPPAPVDSAGPRQPVDSQPERPRAGGTATVAAPRDSSESTVADALASATDARVRATDAGAAAPDLVAGDDELRLASGLRRPGHRAEAFGHLRRAAELFASAESSATARRRAAAETVAAKVSHPAPVVPVPKPAVDTAPIRDAIAAYGRALENRDINALRRVYPSIPSQQAQVWQDLFKSVRDVRATVEPAQIVIDPSGDRATAAVQCTLRFRNTTEAQQSPQTCDFQARLARQGAGWVIERIQ